MGFRSLLVSGRYALTMVMHVAKKLTQNRNTFWLFSLWNYILSIIE